MTDVTDRHIRRRRRRVSGAGVNDSTAAEGSNVAEDEDLNSRVASMASTEPLSDLESDVGDRTTAPADFTPLNRMTEVTTRASAYEREYRLKLIHRMLMRNVPLDKIADQLQVSTKTVMRDRTELFKRLKAEAEKLDIHKLVGDTMGFYQEVGAMGLRAASASKLPMNMRIAAMRTSLAAKNDMHRFLNVAGVFDVLRFKVKDDGDSTDMERLMAITTALLDADDKVDPMQSISNLPGMDDLTDEEEIHLV